MTDASSAAETLAGILVRNLLSSENVGSPASSANGARASLLSLAIAWRCARALCQRWSLSGSTFPYIS